MNDELLIKILQMLLSQLQVNTRLSSDRVKIDKLMEEFNEYKLKHEAAVKKGLNNVNS